MTIFKDFPGLENKIAKIGLSRTCANPGIGCQISLMDGILTDFHRITSNNRFCSCILMII
jgi:hypothetical protein